MDTLELFAKATSRSGFEAIRNLLKVKTLAELYQRFQAVLQDQGVGHVVRDLYFLRFRLDDLLNLRGIQSKLGVQP